MNANLARRLAVMAVAAAALSVPSTQAHAQGFVRTQTCNITGTANACDPGEVPKPIAWPKNCVSFFINEVGTPDVPGPEPGVIAPELIDATRAGFEVWNTPQTSKFLFDYSGLTNEDRAEWVPSRGAKGNANVVVWREVWPEDFSRTAYAITSVNYNPENAEILDSDIELNSEFHNFTVSDDEPIVDVQNTLAHESGHFLGLDHTPVRLATMFGSAPEGQLIKRTLEDVDIEGVSAIYPADGTEPTCSETDGFFEKPSGNGDDDGCCTSVEGDRRSGRPLLLALLFFGLFVARRRRQS